MQETISIRVFPNYVHLEIRCLSSSLAYVMDLSYPAARLLTETLAFALNSGSDILIEKTVKS